MVEQRVWSRIGWRQHHQIQLTLMIFHQQQIDWNSQSARPIKTTGFRFAYKRTQQTFVAAIQRGWHRIEWHLWLSRWTQHDWLNPYTKKSFEETKKKKRKMVASQETQRAITKKHWRRVWSSETLFWIWYSLEWLHGVGKKRREWRVFPEDSKRKRI